MNLFTRGIRTIHPDKQNITPTSTAVDNKTVLSTNPGSIYTLAVCDTSRRVARELDWNLSTVAPEQMVNIEKYQNYGNQMFSNNLFIN